MTTSQHSVRSSISNRATLTVGPDADEDSGVFRTSPGLLRRRALGPWAEGLAQYLAIRIGDVARGRAAFRSLVRLLGSLPPSELVRAPGPRAQLYRIARSIAETECAMPGSTPSEDVAFMEPSSRSGRALERLRRELDPVDAELIELRHARELTIEELACVLELDAVAIELALDTAEARARRLLGSRAPDPIRDHASIYVEAFALARSWRGEEELENLSEITADDSVKPGTLIGGRYQLVEQVGTGAFGDVYRAEDVEVQGHEVALKLLRQPALSEFARRSALRELKLNAAVFHPSLVQFKDHGWYEERLWFVMPWYEGETLEARMRRGGLTRLEAKAIFKPLCRALAALHAAGIRHQDIKPENILLTELPEGTLPVLIDLGVAAEEQETLLGGTPLYFAPEVAKRFVARDRMQGPVVGPAADVFALALSLRNALEPGTQEEVPAGAIQAFVKRRSLTQPPILEARDVRYLRATFDRWLSRDPAERPTASELAEELAILTLPEERRARRAKFFRRAVPITACLAVLFLAVVAFFHDRAATSAQRAQEAHQRAEGARADLVVAGARQRELEEGHAELQNRFEESALSRTELADQLADVTGRARTLSRDLQRSETRRENGAVLLTRTRDELALRTDEHEAERTRAEMRTAERDAEHARAEARAEQLRASDLRADHLNRELITANARVGAIEESIADARAQQRDAEDDRDTMVDELETAERARSASEEELSALRAQLRSPTERPTVAGEASAPSTAVEDEPVTASP